MAGRVGLRAGVYEVRGDNREREKEVTEHGDYGHECFEACPIWENPLKEEITRLKKLLLFKEDELNATRQEAQRWYKAYVELEKKR